jgi:hypothetical protein
MNRVYNIKFVLEAGLSETYTQLIEDIRLWLKGIRQVSIIGLLWVHIAPPALIYRAIVVILII